MGPPGWYLGVGRVVVAGVVDGKAGAGAVRVGTTAPGAAVGVKRGTRVGRRM